ncbi:uncharacterized protein LOC117121711 [Anneissia japonica]|uniref:uncharacterized protein LOC117121711 n=1 Tax=Anneissia japonica TaxID=1529436 RepID=UPI001425AA0C|nr:uncharacterized protein LOC117121711 [Anneissia japonica]
MGFIKDIATGIAHLHGLKIVHRDLKPANILIDSQYVAKIADFGLVKVFSKLEEVTKKIEELYMGTLAGTPVYMAPEVMTGHYNSQADIFSMGIIFCGILDDDLKEQIEKQLIGITMHKVPGYKYKVPATIGTFMQRLVTRMLQKDYHLRPKAHDVSQQLMQCGKESMKINLRSVQLLAAGISSCLGVIVLPPGEKPPDGHRITDKITLHDLFHLTNPDVVLNTEQNKDGCDNTVDATNIDVMFKSIGGSTGKVRMSKKASVEEMRRLIASQSNIPLDSLELFHRKWAVENDQSLEKEGIKQGSVVHVHSVKEDAKGTVYYELDKALLDPTFNYDFTKLDDGNTQYFRGGLPYQRPCGWFRHAIKVKGKYEDDIWLGNIGNRTESTAKEWPVSYHGWNMTSDNIPIGAVASNGLNGIITTPSLHLVAEKFVDTFEFEGNTYQIALQNRINPNAVNGHLVTIPGKETGASADFWLSPKQDPSKRVYDVRPYGILIRRIDACTICQKIIYNKYCMMGAPSSKPQTEVPLIEGHTTKQANSLPYILGDKIGKGHFGNVYKAEHRTTKAVVAVKTLTEVDDQKVESEVTSLRKADHKNIVKFLDFISDSEQACIVLEFCEFGSLEKFLTQHRPDKTQRIKFMIDISAGLAYLHEIHIAHRDLKPANVLVDSRRVAKIADFGLAKVLMGPGSTGDVDKIYMVTGSTIAYMAPEVHNKHYNIQADIFSMALVFCVTISEEMKKEIEPKCLGLVMHNIHDYQFTAPEGMDDFMRKLITSMLQRDYHVRPKAHEVYQQLIQYDAQPTEPIVSRNKPYQTGSGNIRSTGSRRLEDNQDVNGYCIVSRLGTGAFSDVYKAVEHSTQETVALKRIKELALDASVLIEIKALQIAAHKNVVKYIKSFTDDNTLYIVLEYCTFGPIYSFIKSKRPDKEKRMCLLQDIANGIAHLHSLKIVHRDLKPANILVDSQNVAKIADFGLAKVFKSDDTKKMEELYMATITGTYAYMAPEVPTGYYNAQADIFSMGIIFCGILDDNLKDKVERELIGLKIHLVPGYKYKIPATIGTFMERLVTRMLQEDYHLRPKAHDVSQQLIQHGKKSVKIDLRSTQLLAAGISSCLGVIVLPPEEKPSGQQRRNKITLHDLFHLTNPVVLNKEENNDYGRDDTAVDATGIDVMFKSIGGSTGKVRMSKKANVEEMRRLIASQSNIPLDSLELFHRKWAVEEGQSLEKEGINQGSVLHVHSVKEDAKGTVYYELDKALLDPTFNYDFTKLDDGNTQYFRGGLPYQRPCGWFRHAIKVKGEYDDDIWLGPPGGRTNSASKEWPVSYHGSKMTSDNIPVEAEASYGLNGIITTPSLHLVAEKFVETFEFEGNTYQIALQNRINPNQDNGHLITIPVKDTAASADYWLSPKQDPSKGVYDVRPYGILIRRIDDEPIN